MRERCCVRPETPSKNLLHSKHTCTRTQTHIHICTFVFIYVHQVYAPIVTRVITYTRTHTCTHCGDQVCDPSHVRDTSYVRMYT